MSPEVPAALAAYGTGSNGANVRLLAASRAITAAEIGVLDRMFMAIRGPMAELRQPAFAFLPVSDATSGPWMLARLDTPTEGAIGLVSRLWALFLERTALDAIGWSVDRLFVDGFPPEGPPDNTRLAPPHLQLGPASEIDPAACRSFDQVARPADGTTFISTSALAPEAALAILWQRRPPAWRQQSFATWEPLQAGSQRPFDLVILPPRPEGAIAVGAHVAAPALPLIEEMTRASLGIPFPPRPPEPPEATAEAAEALAGRLASAGNAPADALALFGRMARAEWSSPYGAVLDRTLPILVQQLLTRHPQDRSSILRDVRGILPPGEGRWAPLARPILLGGGLAALAEPELTDMFDALAAEGPTLIDELVTQLHASTSPDWRAWWRHLAPGQRRAPAPRLLARIASEIDDDGAREDCLSLLAGAEAAWWRRLDAEAGAGCARAWSLLGREARALDRTHPRRRGLIALAARRLRGRGGSPRLARA